MAGFGEQLQAAAPMFLGIGSQLSGRDPMGIARGMALMSAKQESDKRKAAINNMLSGMGIAGPEKAFLESMPEGMVQQEILRRMQPKPRNLQVINGVVVDMDTVEPGTNFNPTMQPLPPGLFGEGGGAGYNVGGGVRMEGVSDPAMQAWNTFASQWTGPALTVTSAYRDPEHNKRVGGAEKSQHLGGNAFDFSTAGWSLDEKKAALQLARDIGFTGAGIYGNAIHLDVGPPRVWGPSYHDRDAPDWAKEIMLSGGTSAPPMPQQAQKPSADDARADTLTRNINAVTGLLASGWNRDYPEARQGLEYRRRQWEDELDEIEERRKEAAKAAAGPGFDTDLANTYRDDMRAEEALKDFELVQSHFGTIEEFYTNPGPVSDYALAVAFAKMVDPGSVAREQEVAAVQNSTALGDRLKQQVINALNGTGSLPSEARSEIADLGSKLYRRRAERANAVLGSYKTRATRAKIPFDEIWAGGDIRTLPDDWLSSVTVGPNAQERFAPPPTELPQAEQPQPTQQPAPAMSVPGKDDVQAAIDSLTPAQKKTFGRLRTPSAKLDYLVKLGKL